jgi:hypothetical protein
LLEDHVKLDLPPLTTLLGLAVKLTVGAAAPTVTVVDCCAVPPAPLQLIV